LRILDAFEIRSIVCYKEVMVCHPRIAYPLYKNETQIVQRSAS